MRRFFFCGLLIFCAIAGLAQTEQQLTEMYNTAFYAKNYSSAVITIEKLLAISPNNIDFIRERIKMAGALNNIGDFIKYMKNLRLQNNPNAIPTFYDLLNSEFIPIDYCEVLGEYYKSQNDEFILRTWDQQVKRNVKISSTSKTSPQIEQPLAQEEPTGDEPFILTGIIVQKFPTDELTQLGNLLRTNKKAFYLIILPGTSEQAVLCTTKTDIPDAGSYSIKVKRNGEKELMTTSGFPKKLPFFEEVE